MLLEKGVSTTPGVVFGKSGENHLQISQSIKLKKDVEFENIFRHSKKSPIPIDKDLFRAPLALSLMDENEERKIDTSSLRLAGIITSTGGFTAIIQEDNKTHMVGENEMIGNYKIEKITKDETIFV